MGMNTHGTAFLEIVTSLQNVKCITRGLPKAVKINAYTTSSKKILTNFGNGKLKDQF